MEKEKNIEAQSALTPPLKSIVVNGKKKVAVNGVVELNIDSSSNNQYPIILSDESIVKPQSFTVLQKVSTITLDNSSEIDGVIYDYQGTLTSTGSLSIDTGDATLLSNIDLTSLEEDSVYVFSIVGNKSFRYFCAINKFE